MARIGNSVYNDICVGDPLCSKFGFKPTTRQDQYHTEGDPTPMMANSLLYQIDQSLFQEAYTSKYGKLRVFKVMNVSQESRTWLADPGRR
eukprot:gene30169-53953_t